MDKKTKKGILIVLAILLICFVLFMGNNFFLKKVPPQTPTCNGSIEEYLAPGNEVDTSLREKDWLFGGECIGIDLMPNYCEDCLDYSSPTAYYCSNEDIFWVIHAPGLGLAADTKFYGPFEGYPCVDSSKGPFTN